MKRPSRQILAILGLSTLLLFSSQSPGREPVGLMPTTAEAETNVYPGIHNAVAYHDGFISGGAPEGDAGFDTLQSWDIQTIISVDGATPEVDQAEARGMRSIHLPIGYDGIDDERRLQLARAVRDALEDGPVYIHCHHGKHRSAAAAAIVGVSLGWNSTDEMIERMGVSGTSPHYAGLYACVEDAVVIDDLALDAVPADFLSVQQPSSFVDGMVQLELTLGRLREIEVAGWITPIDHPDLVPAAEAGRLVDLFRVLGLDDRATSENAVLGQLLEQSEHHAQSLEDLLIEDALAPHEQSILLDTIDASCRSCHAQWRD